MEQLVTTLETSKRLKAAGLEQGTSYFVWLTSDLLPNPVVEHRSLADTPVINKGISIICAAPTVEELFDHLPATRPDGDFLLGVCKQSDKRYGAGYTDEEPDEFDDDYHLHGTGETAAEALAALYLKLHEVQS